MAPIVFVPRRSFATTALVLAALASAPAGAGVYKCAGPEGVPVYQGQPCAPHALLRDFDADPPPLSILPAPPPPRESAVRSPAGRSAQPARTATAAATRAMRRPAAVVVPGDASLRRFLHAGLTDGEVLARIGRPQETRGARRSATRWIYLPAPGDPETVTIVTLRDGVVVDVDRRIAK